MVQLREARYGIPGYEKSYALLSRARDVDTAVIFVHGFGGKPTSTWKNFQGLADEYSERYPWWAQADMFFYAYDSVHTQVRANAPIFGRFVEDVWHGRWWGSDPGANRRYRSLIFAGHSEGGVIIRRLILDRYQGIWRAVRQSHPGADESALKRALAESLKQDFVLAACLRLFAPACMGTNFSSWIGFLTSFSAFVAALTASSVVRNELLPTSTILHGLKEGTEQAYMESPQVESLFTSPLFGIPDQVVTSDSYQGEELLWDKGYDHFTVCKPTYQHVRPLEFVRK